MKNTIRKAVTQGDFFGRAPIMSEAEWARLSEEVSRRTRFFADAALTVAIHEAVCAAYAKPDATAADLFAAARA